MRKALIVAALAALVATPASARASRQLHHAAASLTENDARGSDPAIRAGKVMGEDPDARVRFELQRDNPFY
jgi:hypothetical protein